MIEIPETIHEAERLMWIASLSTASQETRDEACAAMRKAPQLVATAVSAYVDYRKRCMENPRGDNRPYPPIEVRR